MLHTHAAHAHAHAHVHFHFHVHVHVHVACACTCTCACTCHMCMCMYDLCMCVCACTSCLSVCHAQPKMHLSIFNGEFVVAVYLPRRPRGPPCRAPLCCQSAMVPRALACALLLSCELCRVHGEDNDGPRKNDTTWTRAVIGGIVLVVIVMMMVVGVLVMAAKEEDGRALTKVLSLQSSADGKSAGQDDASQRSQAEPRPASVHIPPQPARPGLPLPPGQLRVCHQQDSLLARALCAERVLQVGSGLDGCVREGAVRTRSEDPTSVL